jgi:hypothetical protein
MSGIPSSFDTAPNSVQGVKTFRRKVETIPPTSLGGIFSPGDIVKLPICTGTPDAWNDNKLMYMQFILTITNSNPFIDYIDFSEAGAASIIEQLVVNANNVPFETISDYNTLYTQLMREKYPQMTKAYFYTSRKDMTRMENNKIKYPMFDTRTGQIMGASNSIFYNSMGPYYASFNREVAPVFQNYLLSGNYQCMNMLNPNFLPDNIPSVKVDPCWTNDWAEETFTFLANAKCVPVGCTTNANTLPCFNKTLGYVNAGLGYQIPEIINGTFTYQVSLPFYSATVGQSCPYPFPTFLGDQMSLELTLARPEKIFKVSMDPVRRIPGTMRDFVVNTGMGNITPNLAINNAGDVFNLANQYCYFSPNVNSGVSSNLNLTNINNQFGSTLSVAGFTAAPFNGQQLTPYPNGQTLLNPYSWGVYTPADVVQFTTEQVQTLNANYQNRSIQYP